MRPSFFAAAILMLSLSVSWAAKEAPGSALSAIRALPRGAARKIARIEARDGTPGPERWYILVNDPKEENGVHEYVVAGGELVASRNISQFADSLKAEDVFGDGPIRVDSDKVATLAQQYAFANNVTVSTMNYALKKEGAEATPLWNVTCLDESGKEVGKLVVSAGKGNVVSHEGFTTEPGADVKAETQSSSDVAKDDDRQKSRPKTVAKAKPITPMPEKKDFVGRVGDSLSKFFTGGRSH